MQILAQQIPKFAHYVNDLQALQQVLECPVTSLLPFFELFLLQHFRRKLIYLTWLRHLPMKKPRHRSHSLIELSYKAYLQPCHVTMLQLLSLYPNLIRQEFLLPQLDELYMARRISSADLYEHFLQLQMHVEYHQYLFLGDVDGPLQLPGQLSPS